MKNNKTIKFGASLFMSLFVIIFSVILSAQAVFATECLPVRIGFLDSGVSVKHLNKNKIKTGENFVFPNNDTDDRIGHGTATAGIVIGSVELEIEGVYPKAEIVPLVCFDTYPTGVSAPANNASMAAAIVAAVDKYDCKIINISMGTTTDDDSLRKATQYALDKGVIVVSAVGNEQVVAPERVYYPAAYDGVIGVGAAWGSGAAEFSQQNFVDVLAPGVNLKTVTNKNAAKWEIRSGSSYACAYVSGVCAKLWNENPDLSSKEVCQKLFENARDIGEKGFDKESGWGIVEEIKLDTEAENEDDTKSDKTEKSEKNVNLDKSIDIDEVLNSDKENLNKTKNDINKSNINNKNTESAVQKGEELFFKDVKGHLAEESIKFCAQHGIFSGVTEGVFKPDTYVSRAVFAVALYREAGKPKAEKRNIFSDVSPGSWCEDGICWMYEKGISDGVGNGNFGTKEYITREQAVTFLYRYMQNSKSDKVYNVGEHSNLLSYKDFEEISDFSIEAMAYAVTKGIIKGKTTDTINPEDYITRAESAVIFKNFKELNN